MSNIPAGERRIALVSAGAALAGGLIVALASIGVALINESGENNRVEQRLDEEARGAARVMVSRFATTVNYGRAALESGRYPSFDPRFVAPISAEDLKLITARLSTDEYVAVDAALRDVASFAVLVDRANGAVLQASDRENLRLLRTEVMQGLRAVLHLAELPPGEAAG